MRDRASRMLVVSAMFLFACKTTESRASEPGDAATEEGALTCANLAAEFATYAAAHDDCSTVDDCTRVGGTETCGCAWSLGGASGAAIRKDAVAGTARYFALAPSCKGPGTCDAAPGLLSCVSGHCHVTTRSCLEPPVEPPGPDGTTGSTCATDEDCDKTGNAIAHCSTKTFAVGPLNPTPICLQFDSSDVCTPSDATTVHFCDGGHGVCVKLGTSPAVCEGACILGADGTWNRKCAGKNGCNFVGLTSDFGTASMVGRCEGGCADDADCPVGSRCDPVQRFCTKTCLADIDCAKGWSGAPSNWKCDLARGACALAYPKKLGDVCNTAEDCQCLKADADPAGICATSCRPGDDCGAGFVCDALYSAKEFTIATQPPELVGRCLKICTTDGDCPNQLCGASAGLAQKTCRPKTP